VLLLGAKGMLLAAAAAVQSRDFVAPMLAILASLRVAPLGRRFRIRGISAL